MSCLSIEQAQPQSQADTLTLICQQMRQQLSKESYNNIKSFFLSSTHHYLQKLIHLHSIKIKQMLISQSKMLEEKIARSKITEKDGNINDNYLPNAIKDRWLNEAQKLMSFLIKRQCESKSSLQIKNIFLQINCLLTYSCPTCLKNNESKPQSIKLIKHFSDQLYVQQPQTMKTISLQQPNTQKPNKLQSILQFMKTERHTIRQKQQAKQRRINKVWNLIGPLLELDREQFTIDYILVQDDKENKILKELRLKNNKNELQISKFKNKAKNSSQKAKQQKIALQPLTNKPLEPHQQKNEPISPKLKNNSIKQASLISKRNNVNQLQHTQATHFNKIRPQEEKGTKICFLNFGNDTPFAKNTISVCKNVKYNHFYRSFKSSKDVQVLKEMKGGSSLNKSLKLI